MSQIHSKCGFTLLELLITVTILGIIMMGLHQVLSTAISAHEDTKEQQELLAQARYAMERMAKFVDETDYISKPDDVEQEYLEVSERILDTYDNATHGYQIDGDGYLDSDNDSDGLVNESQVFSDLLTFSLDKTDSSNWKLQEEMPDYSTTDHYDTLPAKVICDHVTTFNCSRLAPNMVEIQLTLKNGDTEVSLKTRAKARLIE